MIAYFDCSSGISGDMILGALVDAGVSIDKLKRELKLLPVNGYEFRIREVKRRQFRATKVDIVLKPVHRNQTSECRKWKDIEKIVKSSKLPAGIKQKGLKVFKRLYKAEAVVHGGRYDRIHLHELGAVDCLIDIFGTLIGIDMLGINTVYSSPLNLGGGEVKTDHGILPVPAPATLELLKGVPVYSSDIPFELTTPTGAVLISTLTEDFCPVPEMRVSKIGIGAGGRNFKERPNVLRLLLAKDKKSGSRKLENGKRADEEVTIIETNIDDMNPQVYEYVMELLFKAGALDVYLTQVIMKKGRPGIILSVLCSDVKRDRLMDIILRETTSIGLRYYRAERRALQREIKQKKTRYGPVNTKVSQLDKKSSKVSVEYEDCRKIAKKYNVPLIEVMNLIKKG